MPQPGHATDSPCKTVHRTSTRVHAGAMPDVCRWCGEFLHAPLVRMRSRSVSSTDTKVAGYVAKYATRPLNAAAHHPSGTPDPRCRNAEVSVCTSSGLTKRAGSRSATCPEDTSAADVSLPAVRACCAAVGCWRWRFRVKSALGGDEIRIEDVAIDMRGVD